MAAAYKKAAARGMAEGVAKRRLIMRRRSEMAAEGGSAAGVSKRIRNLGNGAALCAGNDQEAALAAVAEITALYARM